MKNQKLFDYVSQECGCFLLEGQMTDIEVIVNAALREEVERWRGITTEEARKAGKELADQAYKPQVDSLINSNTDLRTQLEEAKQMSVAIHKQDQIIIDLTQGKLEDANKNIYSLNANNETALRWVRERDRALATANKRVGELEKLAMKYIPVELAFLRSLSKEVKE